MTALVDPGSLASKITNSMAKELNLEIQQLSKLTSSDENSSLPYLGYVECRLSVPEVQAFSEDCIFLVIPDDEYNKRVPVVVGSLQLNRVVKSATAHELECLREAWGKEEAEGEEQSKPTRDSSEELDKYQGVIKLTKRVKLKPFQSMKVSGKGSHPLSSKRVNIIVEQADEDWGQYTIPSYTFLKPNTKRVVVGLRNMGCSTVEIPKGTCIAQYSPANIIPEMLAPKLEAEELVNCQLELSAQNNVETNKLELKNPVTLDEDQIKVRQARIDKLFTKLDLSGAEGWSESQKMDVRKCIEKHHHIFAIDDNELGKTNLVKHKIELDNYTPFKERYRRIPPHQYDEVKKHLTEMLEVGAIRRSNSPWASAVVLVRKKDGSLRFCIDLRKLNSRTVKDAYSLPRIEESLDILNGSCIFTSIDLKAGYWQVELEDDSIPLTAFTVGPLGFYECVRMPFGLTNAPATFQRLMETCLGDLHLNWCIIYLDDVVIFSKTPEEHIERLDAVFTKIGKAGLKLKPSKCEFFKKRITYLGHVVSDQGIETDPKKIQDIQKWPVPVTVHDVRSFLGFTNYYRKFIYKYAQKAKPLNKLISGENAKKKHRKVEWTEECQAAFELLKETCTDTPVLAYANYKKPFRLNTDASERGLGAVLYQLQEDDTNRVIAFASRTLSKTERNYDAHKLEFLSLKWSITERFHEYLYGGSFDVYTDNNPLTYVLTTAKLDATGQRWIASLAHYDFRIFYRSGQSNVDADSLSRIPWEMEEVRNTPLDLLTLKSVSVLPYMDIRIPMLPEAVVPMNDLQIRGELKLTKTQWKEEQDEDPTLKKFIDLLKTDRLMTYNCRKDDPSDLKCMMRLRKEFFMENNLLYRKAHFKLTGKRVKQFAMPNQFRKRTVEVCHEDYGHLGMDRVLILLQERFYWPKMSEDVRQVIRQCDRCARFKSVPQKDQLYPISASYPLEMIHLDFLSIGGKDDVSKNVLVVTDHFTRYAQCFVTNNQRASTVARVLVDRFFTVYGWPDKILTDRGGSFENILFKEICEMAKIRKLRTSSYHPQTNGQCERFNKTLINMLGTLPNSAKKKWQIWIPTLVHAYNCTTSGVTGYSPYFLIYGRQPRLPIDIEYGVLLPDSYMDCKTYAEKLEHRLQWAYQAAQKCIDKETVRYKKYYDKNYKCALLKEGDLVLVRIHVRGPLHKITDKWEQAPWEVIKTTEGSPLYQVKNTQTGEIRDLHRNTLFPLRMVDTSEQVALDTPVIVEANRLVDKYFACDCKNCRDTV